MRRSPAQWSLRALTRAALSLVVSALLVGSAPAARAAGRPPARPAVAGDALWDGRFELGANDWTYAVVFAANGDMYAGGDFTHIGGVSANHVARWSAATNQWSALGSGPNNGVNNRVLALAVSGNLLYIGGYFNQAGGAAANEIVAWNINTQTWATLNGGVTHATTGPTVNALAADGSGNVYVAGRFDTAGGVLAQNVARWSGSAWSAVGNGIGTTNDLVEDLAVSGSEVYAGGQFSTPGSNIAYYNGTSWGSIGGGVNSEVLALALSGGALYAGGSFTTATDGGGPHAVNYVAQWNIAGLTWSALGTGLDGPDADGIAVGSGGIYVVGRFQHAGGTPASRAAVWNGSTWSALKPSASFADGVDSNGYGVATHGNDVIVTGAFTNASGRPAPHIARWNTADQQWYSPGNSVNGAVNAVVVSGSDVFVGGDFTSAGGLAASSVARWNALTSAWSPLGSGLAGCNGIICLDPQAFSLAVNGNFVYVGGNFTKAGGSSGITANNIARWDRVNQNWAALGGGVTCSTAFCSANVYTLAPDGGGVDAGGSFDTAGAVTAGNVARWTGSAWQAFVDLSMVRGTDGPVYAIAPDAYGGYNIGGSFTSPRTNYVYFDGANWLSFQTAPNSTVRALAVSGNAVYIGGDFTNAAGSGANYIAQTTGLGDWQPLGGSLNNSVYSLALRGNTLFAGGAFTQTGVLGVEQIAAWDMTGLSWSNLGSGTDAPVLSVTADANMVYAGGQFANAGLKSSLDFGRWGQYSLSLPAVLR